MVHVSRTPSSVVSLNSRLYTSPPHCILTFPPVPGLERSYVSGVILQVRSFVHFFFCYLSKYLSYCAYIMYIRYKTIKVTFSTETNVTIIFYPLSDLNFVLRSKVLTPSTELLCIHCHCHCHYPQSDFSNLSVFILRSITSTLHYNKQRFLSNFFQKISSLV